VRGSQQIGTEIYEPPKIVKFGLGDRRMVTLGRQFSMGHRKVAVAMAGFAVVARSASAFGIRPVLGV